MEQHNKGNNLLKYILMIFASVFAGLSAVDIDIYLSIFLKIMSILSMGLIIAINWDGGIKVIKRIFKRN